MSQPKPPTQAPMHRLNEARRQSKRGGIKRELPETRSCVMLRCREVTTFRKPFCVRHVTENPHAKTLARELEQREREARFALRGEWKRLDPDGARAREVLEILEREGGGEIHAEWLYEIADDVAPELQHNGFRRALVESYLQALSVAGRVEVEERKNRRGQWTVHIRLRRIPATPASVGDVGSEERATG